MLAAHLQRAPISGILTFHYSHVRMQRYENKTGRRESVPFLFSLTASCYICPMHYGQVEIRYNRDGLIPAVISRFNLSDPAQSLGETSFMFSGQGFYR